MNPTSDILRGELERLFELDDMKRLSTDLLGFDPESVGSTTGKGAFARALVDHCAGEDALEALADAILISKGKGAGDGIQKAFASVDGPELSPGTEVGGYRIMKKLGAGAIGTVYLADRKTEGENGESGPRRVAIKLIKGQHSRDRAAVRRYLTAMRAIKSLRVPGVAPVAKVGILDDGRPWVATEFVEGQNLSARVSRIGAMHFNEARGIITSVLTALRDLHAKGIVHSDVKSENVFLVRRESADGSRGEPTGVLVDGAVDRLIARGSGLLAVSGTAKALDPELARGKSPSPTSDLYAVGVLLYELLAGRAPFEGSSGMDVVAAHLTREPEPPSQYAPKGWVLDPLDSVVLKSLEKDPAERFRDAAEFLTAIEAVARASRIPQHKAELDEDAFGSAKDRLLADPKDEDLAVNLERIAEPAHAWEKAAEALGEAADKAEDAEVKKSLWFRVARIQENEVEDREKAEAAYRKVLEIDEEDEIAFIGIEELKRAGHDAEGLIEILLEKAEREEDAASRAEVLREIGGLYEDRLEEQDNAFVAYVQALADDPRDDRTKREVARLAGSDNDKWSEAISILSESASEPDEDTDTVGLYVLMGRFYGQQLARPDFAIQCFSKALEMDPRSDAAYDGTAALYKKSQSWQELVTLLTTRADKEKNPAKARDLRAEAGRVVFKRMGDAKASAAAFSQILEEDPAHPIAADLLEEIFNEQKKWKDLAKLLDTRSHHEKGDAKVATLVRIAELWEDRLDDIEKAQVQYEAALEHGPDNIEALKGLERVYARTGKYKRLLEVLEKQLDHVATPRQRMALLERMGGILEEEFVDHDRAISAFEDIVAIEPGHENANTALGRLYRQVQRFDDLALTLDRHAKASTDDERKAGLLIRAVKVLMADVGAPERALGMAERILAIDPEHKEGLDLMARLQAQTGDAAAAIDATDRLAEAEKEGEKKCELWIRAGRMLEDKADNDGAIKRYKRALDAHPESTEAAASLRNLYSARGDAHGAVDLLNRELAATKGSAAKSKLYAEMGDLYRDRLEDVAKARDAYGQALELDPVCTPAAYGLAAMAHAEKNWKDAAKYSEPLLARASEMEPSQARDLCVMCGDALAELERYDNAQRAYLNAKAFAPDDRDVMERVADVTFRAGAADEAAELYRDLNKRFGRELSGGERGRILYRLGESSRRAGNGKEAILVLKEAADLMPESPDPLSALAQVYADAGNWDQVVRTHRQRMEHADDDERFSLLVKVGDTLLEKMGDRSKASKSYTAALEIKADDRNLLTKLMGLYSESKDWSRLVEVILRISELIDDPRQLSKYFNTAAAICHQELGRLDEAADYYEQALENDGSLDKAFEGLVDCHSKKQDWTGLADAYRKHIARRSEDAPEKRAALYDALAEVLHHRLDASTEAVDAYEKAQEMDSENRARAEKLAGIYESDPKRYFSRAVRAHGVILSKSPYRVESYQALRKLYTDMKKPDESWLVCQTLTALSMAEPDEASFFKKHRQRSPANAQDFFTEEMWFNHLAHTSQDPLLTGIFAVITPAVVKARTQALATFKVDGGKKNAETDEAAMAQTLHWASTVSQISLPDLYYRKSDPGGLSFLFTDPPGIGLGKGALAGGPSQALAFVAGRHLAYFRPGFYLRHLVPTGSGLRAWLLASIQMLQPKFPVPGNLSGPTKEALAGLKEHLTGQQKDELASLVNKLLAASPSLDMKKWVAAVDLTADRVGFVLSNSLEIALAIVRASPDDSSGPNQKDRLKELHLYSVSEEYMGLRHKLGIAIGE